MEYSAIIHDMDKRFCYAIDKDLFVIRIQVKRDDIKEIILHYEDKYIPMEWKDTRKTIPMKKVATSQFQDYYEAQIQMHLICLRYFLNLRICRGKKYITAIMSLVRNVLQTETECLTARRIYGRKKCLWCQSGQKIKSYIRFFRPVLHHHSR